MKRDERRASLAAVGWNLFFFWFWNFSCLVVVQMKLLLLVFAKSPKFPQFTDDLHCAWTRCPSRFWGPSPTQRSDRTSTCFKFRVLLWSIAEPSNSYRLRGNHALKALQRLRRSCAPMPTEYLSMQPGTNFIARTPDVCRMLRNICQGHVCA